MAYIPPIGSTVAFQSDPSKLQASVTGNVGVTNFPAQSGSVVAFQGTTPWIITGSVQGTPAANQSVSGTVGASVIGLTPVNVTNFPTNQNVSGSVVSFQGGAWAHTNIGSVITTSQGSVATVIIGGSIAASFTPPANQSVSGTVQTDVRGSVATVIIGGSIATATTNSSVMLLNSTNMIGSVAAYQGAIPWTISSVYGNISGSVVAFPVGNQSVSGTVNVGSVLVFPGIVSTANSTTTPVTSTLAFTGTSEEWKDFGTISVNVFTDAISATNGLSIQQSSDGTNWDITDTYTVPSMAAGQGKAFQVQPAARFGRVVYTQGPQNSGVFRLQTVYHPQYVRPSSQKPMDDYSNETDLEQNQMFGMVFNGVNWDRQRGNSSIGALVNTGAGSVITRQSGTVITSLVSTVPSSVIVGASIFGQLPGGTAVLGSVAALQGTNPWTVVSSIAGGIFPVSGSVAATITNTNVNVGGSVVAFQGTSPWVVNFQNSSIITVFSSPSIVGTYSEDAAHTSADRGLFVMGVRNDTMSSVTSADVEYGPITIGVAGETVIANGATLTKWVQGTADFRLQSSSSSGSSIIGNSVVAIASGGTSVFTYITGVQVVNMGSASVLVTLVSSGSILGYTIAPAGGGSNVIYNNALKTPSNGNFAASISGAASVLLSTQGFVSKV